MPTLPSGAKDVSRYPYLSGALAERGFSDDDLRKIAGGNVLRALRAAEDAATDMRGSVVSPQGSQGR